MRLLFVRYGTRRTLRELLSRIKPPLHVAITGGQNADDDYL